MSLFDKIYYFWEDTKHEQSVLFYMIATFLVMVFLGIAFGLFGLPVALACYLNSGWWLLLLPIAIPLGVGVFCKLIEIVE